MKADIFKNEQHKLHIMAEVARLFRAFPSGKNVDEHTLRDYCEAFVAFEVEVVRTVVDRFRLGEVKRKSHDFPPALADVMVHMRKTAAYHRALSAQSGRVADGKTILPQYALPQYVLPKGHFLNRSKALRPKDPQEAPQHNTIKDT